MSDYHHIDKKLPEILGMDDFRDVFGSLGRFVDAHDFTYQEITYPHIIREFARWHLDLDDTDIGLMEDEDREKYDRILRAFGV